MDPGLRGRTVGRDLAHRHPAGLLPVAHRACPGDVEANPGTSHAAALDDLIRHPNGALDRDGETQPDRLSRVGEDRGIDTDDFSQGIHERSTGVARVDRSVRLDHVEVLAAHVSGRENIAAGSADDPRGH